MNNADGWVTIGTRLDSKQLEKDLKNEEKKLSQFEKEAEKLTQQKVEIEAQVKIDTDEYKKQLNDIKRKYDETIYGLSQYGPISPKLQENAFLEYQNKLEKININYEQQLKPLEEINKKIKENAYQQGLVNNNIKEMTSELKQAKGFDTIKNSMNSIGNSIENVTKKVGRWALALIGIRSLYSGIRRAISIVSSENENISNQINVMRSAIANALVPLVQQVLNLAAKLMVYINYIFRLITGKNLFNFEKAWENTSKNAKSTASSAKDLRKTLAGFDEMNILNDNVAGASGGGSIGNVKLTNPFEGWEDYNIPKWVEKVAKMAKVAANNWEDFAGMVSLTGFAFGVLTGNVGLSVISLIGYLVTQVPRLTNAIKILTGSNSLLEAGLKTLFAVFVPHLGVPLMLADALNDLTTKTGSTAQASNNLREAQKKLKEIQSELTSAIDIYNNAIKTAKEREEALKKIQEETGLSGEELYKKVQDGTLSYLNMNEAQRKTYKAYLDNKDAQEKLKKATDDLKISEQNQKTALDDVKTATLEDALAKQRAKGDYEGYKKTVIDAYRSEKIEAGEARDYIEQACQDMTDANSKTFTKDLPSAIKEGLNPEKYRNVFSKFKAKWNEFFNSLKRNLSVNAVVNVGSSVKNIGSAISDAAKKAGYAKGGIVIPRLASGGIINQPGRGVPIAYGGERGAEAVVPLTDSQQMDLLGQSIARHMVINLTNINQMNGRVISRELQKVQNENDFAYNR